MKRWKDEMVRLRDEIYRDEMRFKDEMMTWRDEMERSEGDKMRWCWNEVKAIGCLFQLQYMPD